MKKESTNERIIELIENLSSELKDHTAGLINDLRSELQSEFRGTRMELLQHIDAIHENWEKTELLSNGASTTVHRAQ